MRYKELHSFWQAENCSVCWTKWKLGCRTWIWCQKATSSSIISNGGHWRAFRKKSNEQFQDQWLQQVNFYIPFMYLRSFPCWFLTTSSNTARRTTDLIWTTQQHIKGVQLTGNVRSWCIHIRFAAVLSQCVVMFPKTILETRQSIFSFKEIVMRAEFLSALLNRVPLFPLACIL